MIRGCLAGTTLGREQVGATHQLKTDVVDNMMERERERVNAPTFVERRRPRVVSYSRESRSSVETRAVRKGEMRQERRLCLVAISWI